MQEDKRLYFFLVVVLCKFLLIGSDIFFTDEYSICLTNEVLPDPLTPVTAVITPMGNFTFIPFRLFSRAPNISI